MRPGSSSSTCSAISQGAAVSIAFSLKHPERVRRLVLLGGYAQGWRARGDTEEISRREAMLTLTELGWGKDNPAYRQLFTNLYVPGASKEQMGWFNELQRRSTSPENAVRVHAVAGQDRRHSPAAAGEASGPGVAREERPGHSLRAGRVAGAGIPGARFVPLDSGNHILLNAEPAFGRFIDEMREFLAVDAAAEPVAA